MEFNKENFSKIIKAIYLDQEIKLSMGELNILFELEKINNPNISLIDKLKITIYFFC